MLQYNPHMFKSLVFIVLHRASLFVLSRVLLKLTIAIVLGFCITTVDGGGQLLATLKLVTYIFWFEPHRNSVFIAI